jgi:hypothetical protein
MTFIISIQLNDSIIVTADNKKVVLKETGEIQFDTQEFSKIHQWDQGIITGTGEYHVITKSIEIFKEFACSDIAKLAQYLDISRQIREFEVGNTYFQIENTKLLCTSYSKQGAQLYRIERFEPSQPYELTVVKPMDITIWLFHPNIDAISEDLQDLYANLKDFSMFSNQLDWVNHYINRLALIYRKQSQVDPLMSSSFNFFFQTRNEYIAGYIPNAQEMDIKFNDISMNSPPI